MKNPNHNCWDGDDVGHAEPSGCLIAMIVAAVLAVAAALIVAFV